MHAHSRSQLPVTVRTFRQRFSSTPRGARLARRLAVQQLDAWGYPYGGSVSETVALIVAELVTNAVTHGCVPGRDFALTLDLRGGGLLAVEVTDTRYERLPQPPAVPPDEAPAESGRGLLIVGALADRWCVGPRTDGGPGKVVRAELDLV
ncbi:ATP-binding protein [Streptomyces sp. HNM0574]|uniref:ATP-binding protein n=1 Tax=Streptomyces sp. HNM0574 TaxID=2714954 RepID=UPI00146B8505|nr:ATP-binding protein [Streptomyces sp. HNM0574]NLU65958.1 ATP-binding protein [Streptomyces sp. HNM0574]